MWAKPWHRECTANAVLNERSTPPQVTACGRKHTSCLTPCSAQARPPAGPTRSRTPALAPRVRRPGRVASARSRLLAVISQCWLRLRQPLITRLLMRPAAVCNHPGPRRAAREAAGESARGGVEGGGLLRRGEIRLVAPRCAPEGAGRCSPPVTSSLSQPDLRAIIIRTLQVSKGTEAQRRTDTGTQLTQERTNSDLSDP